jgi:SAM-dependent methyltransferase
VHESVRVYVARQVADRGLAGLSVVEVGSYDVNGTIRDLFAGPYTGVDMRPGPGVDVVGRSDRLPFPAAMFDVAVSTEMLEHDLRPWLTVAELARVVKPGGTVLLTCRGYDKRGCFPVHDYPDDLWRFTVTAIELLLSDAGLHHIEAIEDPQAPGVFATATKPLSEVT